MTRIFPPEGLAAFAELYPERSGVVRHRLAEHPLLTFEALADLAERMDSAAVEHSRGDVAIGAKAGPGPGNGLSISDTIRTIAQNRSWAVLKNVETDPQWAALLDGLLAELAPIVERATGPMLTRQAYVFISSPGATTPFHFDPEHNVLMQVVGTKTMNAFPVGDERFAPAAEHERYYLGGHRNLAWRSNFGAHVLAHRLEPGDAVHMPVMAPHYVRNGPDVSLSLSITWRSTWSYRNEEACAANSLLRRVGMAPALPPRWPRTAPVRSTLWRAARRAGVVDRG